MYVTRHTTRAINCPIPKSGPRERTLQGATSPIAAQQRISAPPPKKSCDFQPGDRTRKVGGRLGPENILNPGLEGNTNLHWYQGACRETNCNEKEGFLVEQNQRFSVSTKFVAQCLDSRDYFVGVLHSRRIKQFARRRKSVNYINFQCKKSTKLPCIFLFVFRVFETATQRTISMWRIWHQWEKGLLVRGSSIKHKHHFNSWLNYNQTRGELIWFVECLSFCIFNWNNCIVDVNSLDVVKPQA